MEIISREQAISTGSKKYFTGIPCKNGHISERYVTGYFCVMCLRGKPESIYTDSNRTELQKQRMELEQIKSEQRQQRLNLAKERAELVRLKAEQKSAQLEIERKKLELRQSRAESKRADLVEIHVVIKPENYDYFFSVMQSLASLEDSSLTASSLKSPKVPKMIGNHARYVLRVPAAIVEDLRAIESALNGPQRETAADVLSPIPESPRELELKAALKNIDFSEPDWESKMSRISEELSEIREQRNA